VQYGFLRGSASSAARPGGKTGGLAFTAFTGIPTPDLLHTIVSREGFLADLTKLAAKDNLEAAVDGVKSLLKPKGEGESTHRPEEINVFRTAFDDLLEKAGVEQLVVLIDDLDRCLPDTAIETLEAVRLFVFTSRTAFIVATGEAMTEYAVRKHFPERQLSTVKRSFCYSRFFRDN
jgi:KAP family P-loop domain